jgi:cysteine-rich repeat protein
MFMFGKKGIGDRALVSFLLFGALTLIILSLGAQRNITGEITADDVLVGHWDFSDGSLDDRSAYWNDGVAVGGLDCSGDEGALGDGCGFGQAGQYVDISAADNDIGSDQGTILVWVYPNSTGKNRYIVSGFHNLRTAIRMNEDEIIAVKGSPETKIKVANNIELNRWYHIGLTWKDGTTNGGIMEAYLNGKRVGTEFFNGTVSNGGFRIGAKESREEFFGNIDEVRFYRVALEDFLIRDIYLSTATEIGPVCGNGLVEHENDEECDDGNAVNGDGCSDKCQVDAGGIRCKDNDANYKQPDGLNYFVRSGTILITPGLEVTLNFDECIGNTLIEMHCEDNQEKSVEHVCENGCFKGACVR